MSAFRDNERLQPFFEDSVAYAVFPSAWRAGGGFGAALGKGWMIENGEVTGWVSMAEFFAGADLGVQTYRSILFFRSPIALEKFKHGRFEFTGQAHATAATASAPLTPSFSREVAMFVQVKGGLMLEASVGTQRYDFFELPPSP